jgi:hypothetical protein
LSGGHWSRFGFYNSLVAAPFARSSRTFNFAMTDWPLHEAGVVFTTARWRDFAVTSTRVIAVPALASREIREEKIMRG